ncbi:MAG: protein kinase [Rhodothermaceae bacterium]|nr:protein kinase [Rhodothermaceae bacterium]
MDSTLWKELSVYFDQALELPATERQAFLNDIRARDESLWEELVSLLKFSISADSYLGDVKELMPGTEDEGQDEQINLDPYNFVGTRIGQYEITHTLGAGGMGVVYRGKDVELQRNVAIKFLPPTLGQDKDARDRFYVEARAASRLDHPNVCTIHEIGTTREGQIYIVMGYYEGDTLQRRLENEDLSQEQVVKFIRQIAQGLDAAHQQNIVHRDIKPGNVMITSSGAVKILDFGLAKVADQNLTKTGMTMGTVGYMSPELIRGGAPTPASDIWSMGVLLYEMVTGLRPFRGMMQEAIMYHIVSGEPDYKNELDGKVSAELGTIIKRCLQKDPAFRYATIEALLADLDQLGTDGTVRLSPMPGEKQGRIKNKAIIAASILVMTLLAWLLIPSRVSSSIDADKRIALLPFTTSVGDSEEDQVLVEGMMYMLADLFSLMDSPENPIVFIPLDRVQSAGVESAQEAHRRLGVNVVVEGELSRLRDVVALSLNLTDPSNNTFIGDDTRLLDGGEGVELLASSFQEELFEKLAGILDIPISNDMRMAFRASQPTDPDALAFYLQGLAYLNRRYQDNFYEYAIQQFSHSLEEDPLFARSHAGMCEALFEKYAYSFDTQYADQARESCNRAAELGSNQAAVLIAVGRIYLLTGNRAEAMSTLQQAVVLEPDNAEAYSWIGRVHEANLEVDSAIVSYNKAISLKTNNWLFYTNLGVLYMSNDYLDEAEKQFEHVKRLTPDNDLAHANLSIIQFKKGDIEGAKTTLQHVFRLDAQNVYAHRLMGMMLYVEQDFEGAIDTLQGAVQVGDLVSLDIMGLALSEYGDQVAAQSTWRELVDRTGIRLQVDSTSAYFAIMNATAYASLGLVDSSMVVLETISEEQREDYVSYLAGRIYEQNGEREKALTYIERAFIDYYNVSLIERDPFLTDLRETEEYQRLLADFLNNDRPI